MTTSSFVLAAATLFGAMILWPSSSWLLVFSFSPQRIITSRPLFSTTPKRYFIVPASALIEEPKEIDNDTQNTESAPEKENNIPAVEPIIQQQDNDNNNKSKQQQQQKRQRKTIDVTASIELPFSAEVAYDCFSDLPRQPEWSPWLHSVEWVYDDDEKSSSDNEISLDNNNNNLNNQQLPKASKWTLQIMGVKYSWISIATHQERPVKMAWESTSGLKNFGTVNFVSTETTTQMTMTMTFVPPRLVAFIFGKKSSPRALERYMEQTMIGSSLEKFRDVILDTTLGNNATILFPM